MRLAVVGCGDIAGWTVRVARLNRKVQVIAACDRTLEIAQAFARRHGIPRAYGDLTELLAQEKLDAIYLAVPHHLHYPMMFQAVQAGCSIFCEKPITRTLEEGKEIVRLAREIGVKIGVNYQYRYDSACFGLVNAAQNGQLGELYYARCNIPFHRSNGYYQKSAWHSLKAQAGGGTLLTVGSHMLDIALWAFGSPPAAAAGMTAQMRFKEIEVEDLAQGTVQLENGALIQISSSMIATPERPPSIEIYGSKGTRIYHWGILADLQFLWTLGRSIEGFRDWIEEDKPYRAPAEEALPALAVVEALYRSAETGITQPVESYT